MKYMGSKRRLWKDIAPIVLEYSREREFSVYVEPFCGGCNSLSQVKGLRRIAADINPYLIAMWKALINSEPMFYPINREFYNKVRRSYYEETDEFTDAEKGWVGFMASYNGKFFDGGYSGNNMLTDGGYRNYIDEAIRNILSQVPNLIDVEFHHLSYDKLKIPKKSVIYCDPPYRETTSYREQTFDYLKFYDWAVEQVNLGNKVYISEYSLPDSRFQCIWEKKVKAQINHNKKPRIEKLFIPR